MRFPDDVPTLTDGSVSLRAHTAEDARGSWEQCQDPLSQQWTTVPVPYAMSDAREFVEGIVPRGWREDRDYAFAVHARDRDGGERYAGTVSLRPEGSRRAEVAFGSHPWCRGRGVMERAVRLLLDWGFAELDLAMVIWWANKGNWASRRLAWRLGFTMEGTVRSWLPQRGDLRDAWVGTLLRDQPLAPASTWYDVPTITGPTVSLRAFRDADEVRIREACSDPRTQEWLPEVPRPYTDEHARLFLESRRDLAASGSGLAWAVVDPASDVLLANICVFGVNPGREAEVGFWAHPGARGRGVTTEAVRLAARHAFVPEDDGGLGLHRVYAFAAEPNSASRHVLRSAGFTETGRDRHGTRLRDGSYVDSVVHDLLEEEWPGARPGP